MDDYTRNSRLKFTPVELAKGEAITTADSPKKDGNTKGNCWPTSRKSDSKVWFGSKVMDKLGNKVSEEITDFAEKTDDRGIQAADKYRLGILTGAKLGNRVRRYRKSTADKRLMKHENKKKAKETMREFKANRHMERYGELPKGEHKRQVRSQKRKMKQEQIRKLYDKAFEPKKTELTVKVMSAIVQGVRRVVSWLISLVGWQALGIVAVAIIFIVCISMLGSLMTAAVVTISSYTSEDAAIEAASLLATEQEARLEQEINGIPSQWRWGHIDEFRYDLDEIGHDPFELMAYLSVTHPGFDMDPMSPVHGAIRALHESRYDLILEEQKETRTRTETYTDPTTGEETEYEMEYDYYVLNVILRSKTIEEAVFRQLMDTPESELWEWYKVLIETKGARQEFANPFGGTPWMGQVTSLYGYRIDPVSGKNLQIHRGLDIAMPRRTPILAGITGTVRYAGYDNTFGNYVILEDDRGSQMKYAHCETLDVATGESVKAGETVIAKVGNSGNSTGSHLHIEIKKNDAYLNPIYAIS